MKKTIIAPRIHLNGTSKDSLFEALHSAWNAVYSARETLRETCPHDRDYYVIGPNTGQRARDEHIQRMRALRNIEIELTAIAAAIQDNRSGEIEIEVLSDDE